MGTKNSSGAAPADEFECKLAEIVWRNTLKKSFYNYGYGVQFISADGQQQKEQHVKKEVIDSRKYPRKPYVQPVLFAANDEIFKGVSENISPLGIFLKTESRIEVGQKIILSLPTRSNKRLKIRAEVIWTNHEGCGVKFIKKIKSG